MKYNRLARLKFVYIILIFLFFIFTYRLFTLQILDSKFYRDRADKQYITDASTLFERGSILFTKKNEELVLSAMQITNYKLAIKPDKIKKEEIDEIYKKISSIVEIDYDDFVLKANKINDPHEDIKNNLTREEADKIQELKIKSIEIIKGKNRFYPNENLSAHSLGFVGYNGSYLEGICGLEKSYNDVLSRDNDEPYVNFFAEVFSDLNKEFFSNKRKKGDIITSIEPNVELVLEKELLAIKEKYNPDSMGGIILNPVDGSIYAISSKPDFNLNNFSKVEDSSVFRNPIVENVYEFGSIVKPLIIASGIDAKVITAQTTYNDTGSVLVEKKQIFNFDKKGRGPNTSIEDVLAESLNTGMVMVYQKLGKEKMRDYLFSFGIKEKTGIDLPNETLGLVANLNSPRQIEYANASFGQGIALTPIQMVRALSSIANGGYLITPHLVKKIKYDDGTYENFTYDRKSTKISKESAEETTRMLIKIRDNTINKGHKRLENYNIAVKTGTAQVAKEEGGGYYGDRYTHSYFGYFPAYDPKFIILLYAVNPKGSNFASVTWTNSFLNISQYLINYYEIPPDR